MHSHFTEAALTVSCWQAELPESQFNIYTVKPSTFSRQKGSDNNHAPVTLATLTSTAENKLWRPAKTSEQKKKKKTVCIYLHSANNTWDEIMSLINAFPMCHITFHHLKLNLRLSRGSTVSIGGAAATHRREIGYPCWCVWMRMWMPADAKTTRGFLCIAPCISITEESK